MNMVKIEQNKMNTHVNKKNLFIILIIIVLVLISTFVIEYKLGFQPCKLCLYERIPYFISILLISKIFFTKSYERLTLLLLSLVFIISSILAFYHFGIEQGFFKESLSCTTGNLSETFIALLIADLALSKAITFVFGYLSISFEYPPPPKVQSIKFPPFLGLQILITSFSITGKCLVSGDSRILLAEDGSCPRISRFRKSFRSDFLGSWTDFGRSRDARREPKIDLGVVFFEGFF